jgi:hypothetical protein
MHTGTFPDEDSDFNDYIQTTAPYLNLHWERLVPYSTYPTAPLPSHESRVMPILPADPRKGQLQGYFTQWNITFPLSQNPNTRTRMVTETKDDLRELIEDLVREVFADIPHSFLTAADRKTLLLPRAKVNG